jgi:hypothetical protein
MSKHRPALRTEFRVTRSARIASLFCEGDVSAGSTDFFFTADIAKLLGLPEWRVLKFVESKEYAITPGVATGAGSGSRRVYNLENVCEFALAVRLLESGLRSLDIGRVIRELRQKEKLSSKLDETKLYLAIVRKPRLFSPHGIPRRQELSFVREIEEISEILKKRRDHALILVPLGSMFRKLDQNLRKLEAEKSAAAEKGD